MLEHARIPPLVRPPSLNCPVLLRFWVQRQRSPVTEYFFWPRKDAWEELKASLDARSWIGEREKVLLLNQCTEVINAWQAENKLSLEEARAKFPNCRFSGA